MNLRTKISNNFLLRMGGVGLVCIGAGLWFLYDGLYTWPAQKERAEAYLEFEEALQEANTGIEEISPLEIFEEWQVEAAEKGWPAGVAGTEVTPYGKPRQNHEISGQYYFAGLACFIGLIFVIRCLINYGCWIEADEEGMRSSEKRELKFDQVTELNKKKWDKKGIAYVMYEANGRKDRIVLDDCNYERDTTNEILRHVEATIGYDKITNGKPEKIPKPEGEAESAEAQAEEEKPATESATE